MLCLLVRCALRQRLLLFQTQHKIASVHGAVSACLAPGPLQHSVTLACLTGGSAAPAPAAPTLVPPVALAPSPAHAPDQAPAPAQLPASRDGLLRFSELFAPAAQPAAARLSATARSTRARAVLPLADAGAHPALGGSTQLTRQTGM